MSEEVTVWVCGHHTHVLPSGRMFLVCWLVWRISFRRNETPNIYARAHTPLRGVANQHVVAQPQGLTGSYNRVERVAIGIGLFQLVFVVTMFMAQPKMSDVVDQMLHPPLQKEFLYLIAANFGPSPASPCQRVDDAVLNVCLL